MEVVGEDWDISELSLPSTSDLVYYDRKGVHARRRGDYEQALEEYTQAREEAERILEEFETVRDEEDLTDQQLDELVDLEDRIEFYDELLERQIERL